MPVDELSDRYSVLDLFEHCRDNAVLRKHKDISLDRFAVDADLFEFVPFRRRCGHGYLRADGKAVPFRRNTYLPVDDLPDRYGVLTRLFEGNFIHMETRIIPSVCLFRQRIIVDKYPYFRQIARIEDIS